MTVRFFILYDAAMTEIGQVKSDPHRESRKWTALDERGKRIKDCETREDAENQIRMRAQLLAEGWKYVPAQGNTLAHKRQEALDCLLLHDAPFTLRWTQMIPDEGTEARMLVEPYINHGASDVITGENDDD